MISVIICSINKHLAEQVKSNIDTTIGVPWEAVVIDNTNPSRPITAVYNEGVKKAKFPIVCFAHEDIEILTRDWGRKILHYFNNDQVGLIGVAGANYKSKTPSGWMTNINTCDRYNIIHKDPSGKEIIMRFDEEPFEGLKQVVCLDGVFLVSRKKIIEEIPFDEKNLTGFHLYDIDISFRIAQKYKVAVSFEIELIHHTVGGDFGDKWVRFTLNWHKIYEKALPRTSDRKADAPDKTFENQIALFWLHRLKTEKISFINKLRWVRQTKALYSVRLWPAIILFFSFKFLRGILVFLGLKTNRKG